MSVYSLIIIGSGPAAHTAAIYAARSGLHPLLLEGFLVGGIAAGGQLTTTELVENFPGFPQGIMGLDLMQNMREQSLNMGVSIKTETVINIEEQSKQFVLSTHNKSTYRAHTLIIASGASARRLAIPGEDKLWNRGISACAVCDGPLPMFRGKDLFVVGGGDTACEESLFLSRLASQVTLCVRKSYLRASHVLQKRVLSEPKIKILWNTEVKEVLGEHKVEKVLLLNNQESNTYMMPAAGLFYAIGHTPNTQFLYNRSIGSSLLTLDEVGYIVTNKLDMSTSHPAIFAAGDVQDPYFRQAVLAAGTGCMAALSVEKYLNLLSDDTPLSIK